MRQRISLIPSISLALLLGITFAFSQPQDPAPENPIRVWVQPQLGFTAPGPGAGMAINAAYRHIAIGARAQASKEFCLFCTVESRVSQSLLVGAFHHLGMGKSVLIRSGINRFYGTKRGGKEEEYDCITCWGDGYESIEYEGIGVPLEMGIIFGGKNIGFGITAVFEISHDNPSAGLFFGLPLGAL